jgi:hypothetical protein
MKESIQNLLDEVFINFDRRPRELNSSEHEEEEEKCESLKKIENNKYPIVDVRLS